MTIELKVPFDEKEDAIEFQRYLKKNGCQSRLETVLDFHSTMKYCSTVGNIEKFLDDLEKRDSNNENWKTEKAAVENTREWINELKRSINYIYANCEIGAPSSLYDDIFTRICGVDVDFLKEVIHAKKDDKGAEETEEEEKEGDTEKLGECYKKMTQTTGAAVCLAHNSCFKIDFKTGIAVLTDKKPIEELEIVSVTGLIFGQFDIDDLQNAGFKISMQSTVTNNYTVIAGPEFVLMDLSDLLDYLSDYDDEDDDNDTSSYIKTCTFFVDRIIALVEEKPLTIDDLAKKLFEDDGSGQITFDVLDDALQGTLADMKKLGLISIKNGVIKPAK